MATITTRELRNLLDLPGKPCVSVYQPTQPGGAEKDPIQYKNLLADADSQLTEFGMPARDVKKLLAPAAQQLQEPAFWRQAGEGLAVFLTPEALRWYRLKRTFTPRVTVGERFAITPLLSALDDESRFFVLALNQKRIRLWEGDAAGLNEVELKTMPTSLAEALAFHDREEPLMFHSVRGGAANWGSIFHGHGVGIDTVKDDLLLYFQRIDRGLHDYLPDKAPLILAGVDYLWPIYRKANRHSHLLDEGIAGNAEQRSARELHDRAWQLVRDRFEQPKRQAMHRFNALAGTGRTCQEPAETVRAACTGQLETLMVAFDKEAWGACDPQTNAVEVHDHRSNGDVELLNLAAVHAVANGVKVYALPSQEMPDHNSIAGIYWLPAAKHS